MSLFHDPYVSVNQAKTNSLTDCVVTIGVWSGFLLLVVVYVIFCACKFYGKDLHCCLRRDEFEQPILELQALASVTSN